MTEYPTFQQSDALERIQSLAHFVGVPNYPKLAKIRKMVRKELAKIDNNIKCQEILK